MGSKPPLVKKALADPMMLAWPDRVEKEVGAPRTRTRIAPFHRHGRGGAWQGNEVLCTMSYDHYSCGDDLEVGRRNMKGEWSRAMPGTLN